ncbi:hypothetical protein KIN20_000476 [Parelaphostrongylus tenuis]|uniref:Uncharacterized protein n=1 Tax=Parelaphostrongylus tenuis TaxID=148309 RepID=A0AAD5QBI8_PARTN|nr:hypothetical protein KIN20_000476 [Parelaphostrongylus tenuis]
MKDKLLGLDISLRDQQLIAPCLPMQSRLRRFYALSKKRGKRPYFQGRVDHICVQLVFDIVFCYYATISCGGSCGGV